MKKTILAMIAAGLLLACPPVRAATDYSQMSTAALAAMRDTMQNATKEERRAFQQEWQRRVREMTPTERRLYLGPTAETPARGYPRYQGQAQRPEEASPASASEYERGAEKARTPWPEQRREQLLAPPASVAPRRFGSRVFQKEQWQQVGPRRFTPMPDFDGGGSPFDFGRSPVEAGGTEGR